MITSITLYLSFTIHFQLHEKSNIFTIQSQIRRLKYCHCSRTTIYLLSSCLGVSGAGLGFISHFVTFKPVDNLHITFHVYFLSILMHSDNMIYWQYIKILEARFNTPPWGLAEIPRVTLWYDIKAVLVFELSYKSWNEETWLFASAAGI